MTPTYYYALADSFLEVVLHEPAPKAVPEALLHDLWRHQRFQNSALETVGGIPVSVLDPGRSNTDAGPDFLHAKLRLGSTRWTGAVEIHTSSGIWQAHGHDKDPRYNSTLLHVVLYHDIWTGKLRRADGTLLPELVLYPHLESPLRRLIHSFYTRSEERIHCASGWQHIADDFLEGYLEELATERMTSKSRLFRRRTERAIYESIFAGLGYAKNSAAMRTLAAIVPLQTARDIDDPLDVEALYFGASGLLPTPADLLESDRATADYVMDLRERFERLNHRLGIVPMPPTSWRFFRLRPANFPTLRIAQAAALFRRPNGLLSTNPEIRLRSASASERPLHELRRSFEVGLDPFWNCHVRLEKRTSSRSPSIGKSRIDALIVNSVLPALFSTSSENDGAYLDILRRMPASDDEVTRRFAALGTRARNAMQSQAFHQLYRTRCSEARCLTCAVGKKLLAETS